MAEFSIHAPDPVQFGGALICKTTIPFTNIFLTVGRRRGHVKSVCGTQMTTGLATSKRCYGPGTGPGRVAEGNPLMRKEKAMFWIMHP